MTRTLPIHSVKDPYILKCLNTHSDPLKTAMWQSIWTPHMASGSCTARTAGPMHCKFTRRQHPD